MAVITLLSDFGLNDAYVAQMKAVIISNAPGVEIVDISHGVEKHRIAIGSYLLETTVPLFPAGSIHVAVVDPGVGGARFPIVIACERGTLIGPDNGLLARAADRLGFQAAFQIKHGELNRGTVSCTFHGRDIFAYTAAKVASGFKLHDVGPKLANVKRLDLSEPLLSNDRVDCQVLYVDSFGNVVTNISEAHSRRLNLRERAHLKLSVNGGGMFDVVVAKSYFEILKDKFGLVHGSQGYLELALREASAAAKLGVKPLDRLSIQLR